MNLSLHEKAEPRRSAPRRHGRSLTSLLAIVVLVLTLITPALAQRGSFGRGGSFGRSSGGFGSSSGRSSGSFGRSSGGFFGGSGSVRTAPSPSYGGSSSYRAPGSSSFGRSGSFGSSGRTRSTSLGDRFNPPPSYSGIPYSTQTTINYGGSRVPAFGYGFLGGFSLGMIASPWTHWMPFHPAFYVDPPAYYNGAYYAGGFSFFRLIIGVVILVVIFRFLRRLFGGGNNGGGNGGGFGGGRRIKYTVYK